MRRLYYRWIWGQKMVKIVINGKFFSQTVTGVQRYAREILSELDCLCPPDNGSAEFIELILAVDKNADNIPRYENIKVRRFGGFKGNLWEQFSLPLFALKEKAVCVSLCNMAPILKPDIVVIHDVSFKVNKRFFSKKFAFWYNFVFRAIIRRIKRIITVSEFSRGEIAREYEIDPSEITVAYNGWQHFDRTEADGNALERFGLEPQKYCFAMSSLAPNKNFRWIAENARRNPDMTYAVSGAINRKVFGDIFDFEKPENLRFLGYVSDGEAKSLMQGCCLFLFPTFYEGFGIPPLEAITVGTRIAVSDASCMREIFGDNAAYLNPNDPDIDIHQLIQSAPEPDRQLLDRYSWAGSAEILYNTIKSILYRQTENRNKDGGAG